MYNHPAQSVVFIVCITTFAFYSYLNIIVPRIEVLSYSYYKDFYAVCTCIRKSQNNTSIAVCFCVSQSRYDSSNNLQGLKKRYDYALIKLFTAHTASGVNNASENNYFTNRLPDVVTPTAFVDDLITVCYTGHLFIKLLLVKRERDPKCTAQLTSGARN